MLPAGLVFLATILQSFQALHCTSGWMDGWVGGWPAGCRSHSLFIKPMNRIPSVGVSSREGTRKGGRKEPVSCQHIMQVKKKANAKLDGTRGPVEQSVVFAELYLYCIHWFSTYTKKQRGTHHSKETQRVSILFFYYHIIFDTSKETEYLVLVYFTQVCDRFYTRLLQQYLVCTLTLLVPQSRFGDKSLGIRTVCPQTGTAVLKGLIILLL